MTGGVAIDLWGVLQIEDSLGKRSYTPLAGSTLAVLFQRGDNIGYVGNAATPLSFTKTAINDPNNRSLWRIALTAQDATTATSGTLVFTLTEGGAPQKWVGNWALRKLNTSAGF